MIRFCYSPDGNYNLQTLPDNSESFLIDKRNQKLRLFNAEDFYFSVLDSSYIDSSNPSVGLSMLGANRLYKELDLLGQVFDNYVNENDTDISTINEHLVISDGSIIKTNSSVSDLESRIGQFNFNKNYIYAVNSSDGDSELDIADGEGNVIVRLNDGHVQTKHFDSSWVLNEIDYIEENAVMNALIDTPNADLDVVDPSGNVILRLNDGHIQTKNFNSVDCSVLNSNFITLNENVNTYKNSVTSLQEDYRSYKVQIDTDFTNFKNNVIAENSSFRERFEIEWDNCEEVVSKTLNDFNLQIQTMDNSVNRSIADISNFKNSIIAENSSFREIIESEWIEYEEVVNTSMNNLSIQVQTIDNSVNHSIEDISNFKNSIIAENSSFKNSVIAENSSFRERFESGWIEYKEVVNTSMNNLSLQVQTIDNSVNHSIEDISNFKNSVIAENSSFRERFENYWVECEEVVTAAMADLNLQVQTLDSSVKLAISDISNRLDALDSSVNLAISSILSRLDALENRG